MRVVCLRACLFVWIFGMLHASWLYGEIADNSLMDFPFCEELDSLTETDPGQQLPVGFEIGTRVIVGQTYQGALKSYWSSPIERVRVGNYVLTAIVTEVEGRLVPRACWDRVRSKQSYQMPLGNEYLRVAVDELNGPQYLNVRLAPEATVMVWQYSQEKTHLGFYRAWEMRIPERTGMDGWKKYHVVTLHNAIQGKLSPYPRFGSSKVIVGDVGSLLVRKRNPGTLVHIQTELSGAFFAVNRDDQPTKSCRAILVGGPPTLR